MKYTRRADEDRIAELAAKLEGIRTRAERRAARANPAVREATVALKALEEALREDREPHLRAALDTAAGQLRLALGTAGPRAAKTDPEPAKPARRQRAKIDAAPTT